MNCSRFFGLLVLFVFAFTLSSQGQAGVAATDFQCFGASTFPAGLNDAGQVVGWYGPFETGQSFIKKKNGPCEQVPGVQDATATIALGINDPGQIVGITLPGHHPDSQKGSAFLYEKGAMTVFDYPDAEGATTLDQKTCQTFAFSINNRGQIVGLYDRWRLDNSTWVCDGPDKPFMREADGTFVTLPHPPGWTDSVQTNGINPRGMTIGNYVKADTCTDGPDSCAEYGYLRYPDGLTWTIAPKDEFGKTVPDTMPTGINPQGQVVGRYFLVHWLQPVGPCHSFFMDVGYLPLEIKYPNAAFTCIGAINAPGEVSGSWTNNPDPGDPSSWHGFVVDIKALLPAVQ